MGYRHHMYIVPRKKVEDIRNLTYAELKEYARVHGGLYGDDEGSWVYLNDIVDGQEFFDFGKYYDNADEIEKLGTPLFLIEDTQEYFEEYSPYVVEKDAVICAIEYYRKKIVNWYSELLMTQEEFDATHEEWERRVKQEERIRKHLESQRREWKNRFGIIAVDLNMENNRITNSRLCEYEIFELVHQFKTMDWENNTLVFYGW